MRKEIELSEDVLKQIKILAAHENTNPKKYIESLVISHLIMVNAKSKKK